MKKLSKKYKNLLNRIILLFAELLIIIIGITIAFQCDNYRSNKLENKRKKLIYTALMEEFMNKSENVKHGVSLVDSFVTRFIGDYELERMPELQPHHITVNLRTDIWDASLQSGALEILDVKLIFQFTDYYQYLEMFDAVTKRIDRLMEQYIIPNSDKGIAEFYNTNTKKLKSKYTWYLESLENLKNYAYQVQVKTDSLLVEIQNHVEK